MNQKAPVQILQNIGTKIIEAATEQDATKRAGLVRDLANEVPTWVGIQDPQVEIDELRRELADRGRNLAQATNAYNDLEQAIVDARNTDSLEPLHELAKVHLSLSRDSYTETEETGKEGCADD